MFSKLRNKFILTNVIISAVIILIAGLSIYFTIDFSLRHRAPIREVPIGFQEEPAERDEFLRQVEVMRREYLARLAVTLIVVGTATEFLVFVASYYYAERAIEPVKTAYDKQREFIANASHELKTPIAAARANFEALGSDEQPWANNVDMELERASKLVNDLLVLARTDERKVGAKKKLDLVKAIKSQTQLIEARLGEKKLTLDLPETAEVLVAEADLLQILDILLDNAVKYSKSRIVVRASAKEVVVENDGKKIPAEKLERVFERFYQVDKTADGSGLGLAMAKAAADRNAWKIVAASDKKGTKFTLSF